MSKGYRFYNHDKGKWVSGTAALLHKVKLDGGLEAHYEKVVKRAIGDMIEDSNREAVRGSLKVVNGGR